ncbi:uncharacterized protein LOC130958158 [Arachis stenosperma]|uniref:uncharacterized protein LOC130958158 n=1 Tax=Arachis stenosperma TaxID=217475 RepID=UPI0025ABF89D|nr:uncharacterized protein LOC130958158 [Arachis stenosperma]XP_057741085.1 uncharacterized protein LOC130958158 [Arachis stenosperma]XP_057741086.1 uncharacterized protein LOC130958158 [Arachis stenosperma]
MQPINLLEVTQCVGEPTRNYLDQFNDECLEIDYLTDFVTSLRLTNGLLNEDFRKHLTTNPIWTMQKRQSVAREYINDEEISQVVAANKWQLAIPPARQASNPKKPREVPREATSGRPYKPFSRVGKFTNYTLLTAPIVEVYQQIADKGILAKPRQLKDWTGGTRTFIAITIRTLGTRPKIVSI